MTRWGLEAHFFMTNLLWEHIAAFLAVCSLGAAFGVVSWREWRMSV